MTRYDEIVASMREEFPTLRVVSKEGDRFSELIDLLLKAITLGGQSRYLDRYTTVIGKTIYVPIGWDRRSPEERYVTMRHERIHLRQSKRYGLLGMSLLYLVPFFPLGLAYGRARIEWEAYAETLRAVAEVSGAAAARSPELRAHIVRQFTSAAYGWMWPFPRQVERWVDAVLATLPTEDSE